MLIIFVEFSFQLNGFIFQPWHRTNNKRFTILIGRIFRLLVCHAFWLRLSRKYWTVFFQLIFFWKSTRRVLYTFLRSRLNLMSALTHIQCWKWDSSGSWGACLWWGSYVFCRLVDILSIISLCCASLCDYLIHDLHNNKAPNLGTWLFLLHSNNLAQ